MGKVVFSSWAGKTVDNRGLGVKQHAYAGDLGIPSGYDHTKVAAFMGWDGFVVWDEKVNIVDMAHAYIKEVQKICCGECMVGYIGITALADALARILDGKGREEDINLLQWLANGIKENAGCTFGQTAPIPIIDSIKYYRDEYLKLIKNKKAVPKSNYKVMVTAPCMEACPAHLDIPGYIQLIRNQRYRESLSLIRNGVCLPGVIGRVCTAPCEEACRRTQYDGRVCIRLLKRYVADWEMNSGLTPSSAKPRKSKEKVAIIGAGPAGLACSYNLALKGYQVTIFEELSVAGGMAAVGIPQYRLPRKILERDIELIEKAGVEIRLNTKIGRDLEMEGLWKDGYKAIFIAIGAHKGRKMGAEGEDNDYEGFVDGMKFLRDVNLGRVIEPKNRVLVVGGGDVAVDCARSCLRLGFRDVNIVYRRSRVEMPARKAEIEEAEKEGVKISYLVTPTKILARDSKVIGAECIKMALGEPDSSGRRRPIPIKGSEFVMKADMIIPAIGQQPDLSFLPDRNQIKLAEQMTIETDTTTCQTSGEGIFAGGDCVTGPAVLIDALASGNRAAQSIDQYIRKGKVTQGEDSKLEITVKGINLSEQREQEIVPREMPQITSQLPLKKRFGNFREVEKGFTTKAALEEAKRCLRCYRVMVWLPSK